ncbi:MAG: EAL domain-containing protein [Edaphobacter sp.]
MVLAYADEFRTALDADEISPYFQPLVELRTGLLIGFEALARWRHPTHGLIPPDVFIPVAEKSGLLSALTRNLLRRAFTVIAPMPENFSLSFNISAIQFHDCSLPEQIHSAAQQAGFSLNRLILEITESALIDNIDQAHSIAQELKSLNVRLALDDFGTGYSSLRHLQSLPFDELKIDASFIRAMSDTRESRKIVAAVVGLGHSLGLTTVAEGIETDAQADMLLRLGCDLGQGWLYGPPVSASDLPSFLLSKQLFPPVSFLSKSPVGDKLVSLEALPAQRLAQLQAIYDGAPVGLCFLDRNLRYVSINRRLAEMNGVPIAAHLGRYTGDVVPDLFLQFEPYIRRALDGEVFSDLEIRSPKTDAEGHYRTFLVSYQPARDEGNEVVGVSVSVVDITRRKLAEEALQESEALLRAVFDAVPVGLVIAEAPSNRIIMSNPRAESIFRRAIPVGENINVYRQSAAFHADGRCLNPDEYPTVRAMCTGEPTDPEDILYQRSDGTQAWVRATAAPVRGNNGDIAGAVLALQDIDEARLEQQDLLDLVSKLERQLKSRS